MDAGSCADAVRLFYEHKPDVVVTDLCMPGQDGLDLIAELQRHAPRVPIIAVSGGGAGGGLTLEAARNLGADDVLRKPFGSKDVVAAIRKALDARA